MTRFSEEMVIVARQSHGIGEPAFRDLGEANRPGRAPVLKVAGNSGLRRYVGSGSSYVGLRLVRLV